MSSRYLTVFISSTATDLQPHRRAVIDAMMKLDRVHPDAMEYFGARDATAVQFCKRRIAEADVYVGLIGNYRGWEPDGDTATRSITEMEHDWAAELDKARLVFVAPDGFAPAGGLPAMAPEVAARQQSFRRKVATQVAAFDFSSPEALARDVLAAVANYRIRQLLEAHEKAAAAGALPEAAATGPHPSLTPATPEEAAEAALVETLADPDLADLLADPAKVDVREIERALVARAEERARQGHAAQKEGAAHLAESEAHLKAAAADYKRLGVFAKLHDVGKARAAFEKATDADPTDVDTWLELGQMAMAAGSLTDARRAFTAAIEHSAAARNPWGLMAGSGCLGDALVAAGDLGKAAGLYQCAAQIGTQLVAAAPNDLNRQHDVFVSHIKVGELRVAQGNLPEALKAFQDSLTFAERLAKTDPANTGWQRDLSVSYDKIGDVRVAQGNLPEALEAFQDSHDIFTRLTKTDPANTGWQRDLSVSYNKIGDVLVAQGNLPEALKAFQADLAIAERLAKTDPSNTEWQRDLSVSHQKIGDLHAGQGELVEALKCFQDSHDIFARLAKTDPGNAEWQADLAASHGKLGKLHVRMNETTEALRLFKTGRAIVLPLAERSGHQLWIGYLRNFDTAIASLEGE